MSKNLPSSLRLKVITPQKLLVDEEVESVSLPSLEGYLGILPGHRPLLVALGMGMITYSLVQKEKKFYVEGGYAEIFPEKVVVFTEISNGETHAKDEG